MIQDLSINCKSYNYKMWLYLGAYPLLLLLGIIFPSLIFVKITDAKRTKHLMDKSVL